MSNELWTLSASEIARRVRAGELSARETTQASLARIEATDQQLNAFLLVDRDGALKVAERVDAQISRGDDPGILAGVPVAIKDVLCIAGQTTTCGSRILADFKPPYTATAVQRLLAAGAVPVGKTNLDEFAMGSSTENSGFRPTRNPWDQDRVPGGSSGGSAAAVAAGQTPVALGSDTGGSIRQPACLCGVVGYKPTYGTVSRYGLVAFASSLDQIGAFGRTVEDVALVLCAISGKDPLDATSADRPPVKPATLPDDRNLEGVTIGVPAEYFGEGLTPDVERCVRAALDVFTDLGADVVDVSLPHTPYYVPVYYLIATAEAGSNLARYEGVHYGYRAGGELRHETQSAIVRLYSLTRGEAMGAEVKRRIMLGTYALSAGYKDAYYLKALKVRGLIRQDFINAFEKVDYLATPTAPTVAFKIGEKVNDPLAMYLSDVYTLGVSLAGVPGVSVPCGSGAAGMPAGLQIIGRHFDDAGVLKIAGVYQQATAFHQARPAL